MSSVIFNLDWKDCSGRLMSAIGKQYLMKRGPTGIDFKTFLRDKSVGNQATKLCSILNLA